MNTETFRIDFLRTPFVVMYVALLAWVLFLSLDGGPALLVVAHAPLVLAAPVAWYLFVVQIGPQGITLYRVNRVRWVEITKAKEISFLGLPYLCLWRTSWLPWWVPLYVVGSQPLISRLQAWCPADSPIASTLSQLSKCNSSAVDIEKRRRIIGWSVLAGALTVFLYSMAGMVKNASFSVVPNYPHELAVHWHHQWLTAMGISLFVAFCAATFLWIKRKRPAASSGAS